MNKNKSKPMRDELYEALGNALACIENLTKYIPPTEATLAEDAKSLIDEIIEIGERSRDEVDQFHARGRCEDFPCCGHVLGECPTGPAKPCPDCGRMFEPCSNGSEYCLACGSRPAPPQFSQEPCADGKCDCCERNGERVLFRQGNKRQYPGMNLCRDCVDEWYQAAADDADDLRNGAFD